jgi:peptidoglycan/xylan/chitin deacetylase (PgdA/CDA1 family)
MKNKGTIALLIVVTVCLTVTILPTADISTLFATPAPKQVYQPTIPSVSERVVCIAFDDGWKTHLEAASILESYNYTATFPIITSYVGYPAYMDWADIDSLAQRGNDIVSHTSTHCNLSAVDEATLQSELGTSQQVLSSKGYAADVLIYPYGEGASNNTVCHAVAQYYLMAAGTQTGKCELNSLDRYDVTSYVVYHNTSLADFASNLNGTKGSAVTILYYHKISNENTDNAVTKEAFQAQLQYLKDNGFTVRTISEEFLKQTP